MSWVPTQCDVGEQGGELGTDTVRFGVIMLTVLRFCHCKQSATLSAWHPVLCSDETYCWSRGTLPLRTITPNGRRLAGCTHPQHCLPDFADPEAESALPACTDTTVFSTCTSEWSILSGLVLQLTLLSALAAPGLTTTMLSTLPV